MAVVNPKVTITSFGYGHGPAPEVDLTVDARRILHDPHVDPAMRQLTGEHLLVRERVLTTPGVQEWIVYTVATVHALTTATGKPVTVAVGCTGGRHRSVVMAGQIAAELEDVGSVVRVEHRDIHRPVIQRSA